MLNMILQKLDFLQEKLMKDWICRIWGQTTFF